MKTLLFILSCIGFSSIYAQNGNFKEFQQKCSDEKERPFVVYSPTNENTKTKKPLLVFLHGNISSPMIKKDPVAYSKQSPLISVADKGDFYMLFCYGQQKATWFDKVGSQMVLDEIQFVKENFPIDENKVFLSGFSDGASGVYYFSMAFPDVFAGYIAMNGSVKIADKLTGSGLYPENMNNVPMYIINTKNDVLYPIGQMQAATEYLQKYNPNIIFKILEGEHFMSYIPQEQDNFISFIKQNTRKPFTEISWETKSLEPTQISWLKINKIDTLQQPQEWHQVYDYKIINDKADFGLKYDYTYNTGKGLKVEGFKSENATAKKMGVEKGDIILMMENDTITSPYDPYYYIAKKKAGDFTKLTILRNGETQIIEGKFNEGYPYRLFTNKQKSGKVKAFINGKKLIIKTSCINNIDIDKKKLPSKIKKVIIE
ncbi:MAG: PDZ domain-containing protein [Capnocytophaga sp.]|nr:PDZ domain-containing protein [Capnocytophaga sp.]